MVSSRKVLILQVSLLEQVTVSNVSGQTHMQAAINKTSPHGQQLKVIHLSGPPPPLRPTQTLRYLQPCGWHAQVRVHLLDARRQVLGVPTAQNTGAQKNHEWR